ncbi:Com family DNA-binding transcriptional regulator [Polaribacter aestuariivivens]|uniref:Com family DNA-binding transcriptional regulator n=1 Tax=Polaribacter aestuariivivens TaxID=2304626 RepID=UPI003F491D5E
MPQTLQITEVRCPNCNRKICDASGEFHLKVKCPKCRSEFEHKGDIKLELKTN